MGGGNKSSRKKGKGNTTKTLKTATKEPEPVPAAPEDPSPNPKLGPNSGPHSLGFSYRDDPPPPGQNENTFPKVESSTLKDGIDYWSPQAAHIRGKAKVHPVLLVLLLGTLSPKSPFSLIKETNLLKMIWAYCWDGSKYVQFIPSKAPALIQQVPHFPKPSDININMMPFYLYQRESLPESCRPYWDMLFKPLKQKALTKSIMICSHSPLGPPDPEVEEKEKQKLLKLCWSYGELQGIEAYRQYHSFGRRDFDLRCWIAHFHDEKAAHDAAHAINEESSLKGTGYRWNYNYEDDTNMEYLECIYPIDVSSFLFDFGPEVKQGWWNRIIDDRKVAYMTIQESWIPAGSTHRRPGLHTDSPLLLRDPQKGGKIGKGAFEVVSWGHGEHQQTFQGGMLMASSISNTCQIYKENIVGLEACANPESKFGNIEHLRPYMSEGIKMQGGEVWWITDTCPHESLPVKEGTYRQFVRVVLGDVGVWFKMHSTENPYGVVPPKGVEILEDEKFEGSKNKFKY